jgi:hypothetical protein
MASGYRPLVAGKSLAGQTLRDQARVAPEAREIPRAVHTPAKGGSSVTRLAEPADREERRLEPPALALRLA